jgi:hypothetical protein
MKKGVDILGEVGKEKWGGGRLRWLEDIGDDLQVLKEKRLKQKTKSREACSSVVKEAMVLGRPQSKEVRKINLGSAFFLLDLGHCFIFLTIKTM